MRILVEKEAVTLMVATEDCTDDEIEVTIRREDWNTFFAVAKAAFGVPKAATGSFEGFDSFWSLYPRKIAKAEAANAWRASRASECLQSILDGLSRANVEWQFSESKFIPHASTWLRQRRWEDESSEDNSFLGTI